MKSNLSHSFINMLKRISFLALPMAGAQFVNVASGFLCMTMLARLGTKALAASALIFSTQLSIMVTGMSILFSLSVLIGRAFGAKEEEQIGTFTQQGWTLAILIGLPLTLLFWYMDSVLAFLGQSPALRPLLRAYFHAYAWAVIPGLLATCNQQLGYSTHRNLFMLISAVISVIFLLVVSNVLIFGRWGFPALGVAGLGYGITAQYLSFLVITTFVFQKTAKQYALFRYRAHRRLQEFIQLLRVGWPICIQMGGEMLSFFVGGILVGWIGTQALSAFQIVNQYYVLIIIPMFSLSQASCILVAQASGEKHWQAIKPLSYASLLLVIVLSGLVAVLFLFYPEHLASVYLHGDPKTNQAILTLTTLVFAVIAFSQFFDAIRNVLIGLLRGLLDTRFSMLMSLLSIWVIGMPLSYLFAFPLKLGLFGFVLGGMIGMLLGVLSLFARWIALMKRNQAHFHHKLP